MAIIRWPMFSVIASGILLPQPLMGADQVSPEQLLSVVRSHEADQRARIRSARWAPKTAAGSVKATDPLEVIDPDRGDPRLYYKRIVTLEPPSGRYRMDVESVTKWVDGDADTFAATESLSFDGTTERWYRRGQGGSKIPPPSTPGLGTLGPEQRNEFLGRYGYLSGIGYFPPNQFNGLLSDFIEERASQKQPLEITPRPDGTWIVTTAPAERALWTDNSFRFCYDPLRGLVQWGEWVGKPHLQSAWAGKTWKRQSVQWKEHTPGIWVPQVVTFVNLIDRQGSMLTYSEIELNRPYDESVFRITFPIGTKLRDEVEKKSYTVSGGIVDEQEAVRQFMAEQAFFDRGTSVAWWQRWWVYGPAGLVGAFLSAAAFIALRRRRRAAAVALVIVGVAGPPARAADPDEQGNWRVSHASGESYPISQCGLNVTVFTLEYFRVAYDIQPVSLALPPNEEGIRLLDIKTVLEAHGLEVIARDRVALSELRRVIRPGVVALFPVKVTDRENHYLIAAHDERRGRLVIDPPVRVTPFDEALSEDQFMSLGGLVLFVRRPGTPPVPQSQHAALDPAEQDLGLFRVGTPEFSKPIRRTLTLENRSEKPVLVSSVVSPCGCLQVKWNGGVIGPGAKREIPVSINPGGWGWGHVSRTVTVSFADGSRTEATLTAYTPQPEESHKLSVTPDIIRFEVPRGGKSGLIHRTAGVTLGDANVSQVAVASGADWLTGRLVKPAGPVADLDVSVDVARLPGPPYPATADLKLSTVAGIPPVTLRVLVSRPVEYVLSPAVVTCARGGETSVSVRPAGDGPRPGAAVSDVRAPAGVTVGLSSAGSDFLTLRVGCDARTPAGFHLVRCRLGRLEDDAEIAIQLHVK